MDINKNLKKKPNIPKAGFILISMYSLLFMFCFIWFTLNNFLHSYEFSFLTIYFSNFCSEFSSEVFGHIFQLLARYLHLNDIEAVKTWWDWKHVIFSHTNVCPFLYSLKPVNVSSIYTPCPKIDK